MNRSKLAWLSIAAVAIVIGVAYGQPPDPVPYPATGSGYPGGGEVPQEITKVHDKVMAALQKHSEAETDEQRAAAQTELHQAVSEQFEMLTKPREAQIEELIARLDKLTRQLEKRREAKEEIVRLRVQVLIDEAEGLGFYPESGPNWPGMTAPGPGGLPFGPSGGSGTTAPPPPRTAR
jgi:hypothetical protein